MMDAREVAMGGEEEEANLKPILVHSMETS